MAPVYYKHLGVTLRPLVNETLCTFTYPELIENKSTNKLHLPYSRIVCLVQYQCLLEEQHLLMTSSFYENSTVIFLIN